MKCRLIKLNSCGLNLHFSLLAGLDGQWSMLHIYFDILPLKIGIFHSKVLVYKTQRVTGGFSSNLPSGSLM